MTKTRPSFIDNLNVKFSDPNSGFDHNKCIERSSSAIQRQFFTRLLDDYPPFLGRKDMQALCFRYIDLLRRLPAQSLTEDYQIAGYEEIKRHFDKLITDIARIGSKELLDFADVTSLDNPTLNFREKLAIDLTQAVRVQLLKESAPTTNQLFDKRGLLPPLNKLIKDLIAVSAKGVMQNSEIEGFALLGSAPSAEQSQLISQDIARLTMEVLLNDKFPGDYAVIDPASKRAAVHIIQEIYKVAKQDHAICHATLKQDVCEFLHLDHAQTADKLNGHAVDVVIAYLGGVMADIQQSTKAYGDIYTKAHLALNIYLNTHKYSLVKQGMLHPDNTIDLTDRAANFRYKLNYPLEHTAETLDYIKDHKVEAAAATGLTVAFGFVGLGGYLFYKFLSSDESDDEQEVQQNVRTLKR